jgi:hypothetical protein
MRANLNIEDEKDSLPLIATNSSSKKKGVHR